MLNKGSRIFISLILSLIVIGCNDISKKFKRSEWLERTQFDGPDRDDMAKDLLKNYKMVGSPYNKIVELLGRPNGKNSSEIFYELSEDFGDDMDPISGKNLILQFNKDSIVTKAIIKDWKH